jgi:hypothetical protein
VLVMDNIVDGDIGDLAVGFTLPQIRSVIDALVNVEAASLKYTDWVHARDWRAQLTVMIGPKIDEIKCEAAHIQCEGELQRRNLGDLRQ